MKPVLRMLEEWTTHQDYLWFLALLAWAGVLCAEFRRKENRHDGGPKGWLMALAAAGMTGAMLELMLLAQHLKTPYTRLDVAMGVAQAVGTGALLWEASASARFQGWWRTLGGAALLTLAGCRAFAPLQAGIGLAVLQAAVVVVLSRRSPRALPHTASLLLIALPVIATHGPWAYAIGEGRRTTDWSHFALFAAATSLAAGAVLAAAAWRRRLEQVAPEGTPAATLRRDLRWAIGVLALWLAGGVLLAVWYGRIARRAFEENLLRRVDTAVLALDERAIIEALGPELRITSIVHKHYPNGRPVAVGTAPHTRAPVYAALRAQMARVRQNNPDFQFFYIATWREGHLLVLNSLPRSDDAITHVIHHDVTPTDVDRLAAGKSFLEGPVTSESWHPLFSAKAALRHPDSGLLLGWLVADVQATVWTTTFTQARLQTMALVGAGVGLWALAVAYRLRREGRDAAERKAAEAAAADRMKSAFLAKVSHELRTPIQSILGYGELLEGVPLDPVHRGWLEALRSHGDIMLRLVNDLIDLGALQSGAFQLEPGRVALRTLIDGCATALRPAATAKGLEFHTRIAPSVPDSAWVDGVRLRQILLNLLTNAVKFTPAGRVQLDVQCIDDTRLQFVVSDTGPGIPNALRSRLFQPFARLDPAAGGGSGLGLALVHGLCAAMGGTVRLADDANEGAKFVVNLPLSGCEAPARERASGPISKPSLAGIRVLVAEDNTLVRELLVAFLKENGAIAVVAADGLTALTLAREDNFDVLLLDIALPKMDGIAVTEALRQQGPNRLRIIGLSAHVGVQDQARARNAGMDDFLTKPVRLTELAAAIIAQLREKSSVSDGFGRIEDETLRSRLVAEFANETPRVLAEMHAALEAGDWPRLRARAHYLKNSADVLGANELQEACQRLAAMNDLPSPAAARQMLEAIEMAIPAQFSMLAAAPGMDKS